MSTESSCPRSNFNPQLDLATTLYLSQLWWYSLAVLHPAQLFKRLGVFPKISVGKYPPTAPRSGQGKLYSLEYREPVCLDGDLKPSALGSEIEQAGNIHEAMVAITRAVHEEALILIQRLLPPAARILVLGCGSGSELFRLTEIAPDVEVVGVDSSRELVSAASDGAKQRGLRNAAFFQADPTNLPEHFAGRFDAVHSSFVFHRYPNPGGLLSEMHRVLVYGGKAFVVDGGTRLANFIASPLAKWSNRGRASFHTGEDLRTLFLRAKFSDFYWEELLPGIGMCISTK
jgi:ubiquinone/menaquinone biosynthesis C-methylase UbiE